jgi:hypothetical protein
MADFSEAAAKHYGISPPAAPAPKEEPKKEQRVRARGNYFRREQ